MKEAGVAAGLFPFATASLGRAGRLLQL